MRPVSIVWFKRDLRVVDHAPLAEAARAGAVLPLFVVEPGLWAEPDASGRQWDFVRECLLELRDELARLGAPLVVRVGEVLEVLEDLRQRLPIAGLWAHEETGNLWTFARDRRVRAWARTHRIPFRELRQSGVIRGLRSRSGWSRKWDTFMRRPTVPAPDRLKAVPAIDPGPIPELPPGLTADPCPGRQPGGRSAGLALLRSFLETRCLPYQRAMSAPESGAAHCSRLSPHLAWGTISIRAALQAAEAELRALDERREPEARRKAGALRSFVGRLHWRCHFVQKLEDEPEIGRRPFHPFFAGLRGEDPERLAAWAEGRTGWPPGGRRPSSSPMRASASAATIRSPSSTRSRPPPGRGPSAGASPIGNCTNEAAARARAELWAIRRRPGFAELADAIQEKHGSRKAGVPRPDRRRAKRTGPDGQLRLDL